MDSIEKAMLGRSAGSVVRPLIPAVAAPVATPTAASVATPTAAPVAAPARDKAIEPTPAAVNPPIVQKTTAATVKRTQQSVTLDLERIRALGMLAPDAQSSRIKEEYRQIKRPLLMNIDGKGAMIAERANLIMVTSACPGEGKTFTACNLALSIAAERNRTVLLVDADILKPAVMKLLGFEAEQGLVDFLVDDQLELADVLFNTSMPSLMVLPAGGRHHLSAELLAGDSMRRLTSEMSRRYPDRIVIFDSPPLLSTTEAGILASLMGQIVMVVDAGRTLQSQVREALATLSSSQTIGFVLNKTRDLFAPNYHGYDYGYPYAQGGEENFEVR